MSERYDGKPFLRLIDCYVLDAIGHLDDEQARRLEEMTPKFRDVFGVPGTWREIVERRMDFPADMATAIRRVWDEGHDRFVEEAGREPDPAEFTQVFVDTNFPH